MGKTMNYDIIQKYNVRVMLKEPLHVGASMGDENEVLVNPVTGIPFIQASSITGALRAYCKKCYPESEEKLFGSSDTGKKEGSGSRIRVSDGILCSGKDGSIKMEIRPRVKIAGNSGTASKDKIKGTAWEAGHKFEMFLVGAGSKADFSCHVFLERKDREKAREVMTGIFSALNSGEVQLGGQKSNGCGYFEIESLILSEYDMQSDADRDRWIKEEAVGSENLSSVVKKEKGSTSYEIHIVGKTEGELQVKGIAVSEFGENVADTENIRNADNVYIVPGSSVKGSIRSRMESIAQYIYHGEGSGIIENTFGKAGDTDESGKTGNMFFYDTVVGDAEENDRMPLRHHIHIDKFTGGVMYGAKFSEKNIAGGFDIRIVIKDYNGAEKSLALLVLALRDLASGCFGLGSGCSIGKGFLNISKITITKENKKAEIDFGSGETKDEDGLLGDSLQALLGGN